MPNLIQPVGSYDIPLIDRVIYTHLDTVMNFDCLKPKVLASTTARFSTSHPAKRVLSRAAMGHSKLAIEIDHLSSMISQNLQPLSILTRRVPLQRKQLSYYGSDVDGMVSLS